MARTIDQVKGDFINALADASDPGKQDYDSLEKTQHRLNKLCAEMQRVVNALRITARQKERREGNKVRPFVPSRPLPPIEAMPIDEDEDS